MHVANDALKQALHDALLVERPEGTTHGLNCAWCPATLSEENTVAGTPATDVQAQPDATVAVVEALNARIAEQEAQIASLESAAAASIQESAAAAAQAELDVVHASLKAAEDRAVEAESQLASVVAFLEAENAKAQVRDERVSEIRELDVLSQERIEARADEWASMTLEAFTAVVEDLRATKNVIHATVGTLPSKTAMTATASNVVSRQRDFDVIASARAHGHDTALI